MDAIIWNTLEDFDAITMIRMVAFGFFFMDIHIVFHPSLVMQCGLPIVLRGNDEPINECKRFSFLLLDILPDRSFMITHDNVCCHGFLLPIAPQTSYGLIPGFPRIRKSKENSRMRILHINAESSY